MSPDTVLWNFPSGRENPRGLVPSRQLHHRLPDQQRLAWHLLPPSMGWAWVSDFMYRNDYTLRVGNLKQWPAPASSHPKAREFHLES